MLTFEVWRRRIGDVKMKEWRSDWHTPLSTLDCAICKWPEAAGTTADWQLASQLYQLVAVGPARGRSAGGRAKKLGGPLKFHATFTHA
ncbi:unnamed protein product [Caenorhabditis auriculariae]|uniref:Uncharacterized protein n=1 Tax=Caenorhabditis auriculariae TaxID=2777116 RepID=A0A8S1GYW5_9PELO|nr:unnamed protein product [Caenorhabditis auriculariae]